jgi:hypothetical protein
MLLQHAVTTSILTAVYAHRQEVVMRKRLIVMWLLTLGTMACSPAGYPLGTPFNSLDSRRIGPAYQIPAPLPVGRWDNVMMLPPAALVEVLLMDGSLAAGPIVSAAVDHVRLRTASGEVDLLAKDVMRVDRQARPTEGAVRNGARGAAFGAGVIGVIGLVAGKVPPARLFLAGGIVGGQQNIELNRLGAGSSIVYLAPAVFPGRAPAAQYRPR